MLKRNVILTLRGLPSDLTCVLEAEPGKLDIKRRGPVILFISLPSRFTVLTSGYDVICILCRFSVIGDVIQKVQRHHNLIMAHAVR